MYKIMLITTKGCEGCTIMRHNTQAAVLKARKEIEFEIKDRVEVGKKFLRTFNINDFPTILLFKDNEFKFKYVGSMPTIVVTRWIDIYFK